MPNNQNLIIAVISGTILFLLVAGFIVIFVLIFQRRRQQHTLEIANMKNQYEQELLRSQLEIQEQTLRTISQEIHDNIGQVLTLAKLQLYALPHTSDIQPTYELISKSINDLRDLSKSLNPDRIADVGLVESMRHELQMLQKTNVMATVFDVKGVMQRLAPEKEIIVFRIFQELMNNTIKHSHATLLKVELEYTQVQLVVRLSDNGIGFKMGENKGVGLNSMYNRAAIINASLEINSEINNGTVSCLVVPLLNPKN